MLVNNQKSGRLGQGCDKDCTHKGSVSHRKPLKIAFRNYHTQILVGEMLRNQLERMQPSHGPEESCRGRFCVKETGNQHLRHVTHIGDQSLSAKQYIILRRSHGQVTKVPGQAPHITTVYSAHSRCRMTRARVCLHIQKPKPQATIKNEIEKIHKLFDVYNYTQMMIGVGQLWWQCYRRHQQTP